MIRAVAGLALLFTAAVALLAPAAGTAGEPAPSRGSVSERGLSLGFADPRFAAHDANVRNRWYDESRAMGSDWARIAVGWAQVGPEQPAAPANPADPAYRWGGPDAAVRSAAAYGMPVLITISNAPAWAEGGKRPAGTMEGTWKPKPKALGAFAAALARRYSGTFPDPLHPGETLPLVSRFETWNEPNLPLFLGPQRTKRGEAASPDRYRAMSNAVYDGVHAVQPNAQVVVGSLSPIGSESSRKHPRIGPLEFLRELFCVKGEHKLRAYNCGAKVKLDAFSHHPINSDRPPTAPAMPGDAGVAEMGKVIKILRAAEKGGNVATPGKHPVWATELWWHSKPGKAAAWAPSPRQQALYIEKALYLLWKDGVDVALLYQVADQVGSAFQTGVLFADGTPKPSATAYRFPLVGDRRSDSRVRVWGRAPFAGTVSIQVRGGGGEFETVEQIPVPAESVFQTEVRLPGEGTIRAQLGSETSLPWRQKAGD